MHGMASDRHVMAWHGRIAAHRGRRGAARRHPSEFRRKDYGPAVEKNPTPPDRETEGRFGKSAIFPSRLTGSRPQWRRSDFFSCRGIVFAAKCRWIVLYKSAYNVLQGPARVTILSIQYAIRFGGHSAKHYVFIIHVALGVPYSYSYNI